MSNFLDLSLLQILDLRHLRTSKLLIVNLELEQNHVWHNAAYKFKCFKRVNLTRLYLPKLCSKLIQISSNRVFLI